MIIEEGRWLTNNYQPNWVASDFHLLGYSLTERANKPGVVAPGDSPLLHISISYHCHASTGAMTTFSTSVPCRVTWSTPPSSTVSVWVSVEPSVITTVTVKSVKRPGV